METTKVKRYAVSCGKVPSSPSDEGESMVFIVDTVALVKTAAREFIQVFPTDLDDYQADIDAWTGHGVLVLSHQDDDYFLFTAAEVVDHIPPAFSDFVDSYRVNDEDKPEDEDDEGEEDEDVEEEDLAVV